MPEKTETRIGMLYPFPEGNVVVPCVIRNLPGKHLGVWLDEDDDSPSMTPFEFRVRHPDEKLYSVWPLNPPNTWLVSGSVERLFEKLCVVEEGKEKTWFDDIVRNGRR